MIKFQRCCKINHNDNKKNNNKLKKILLVGNPNVGKSVIFSRLSGVNVISSNYPGTTIDYMKGYVRVEGEKCEIIDVPGMYSIDATNKAEEVATEMLHEGDVIINVMDATNLERNLYLTLELLENKIPMIIALNMWDDTKHKGVHLDLEKLRNILKVPIVTTVGLTGEGLKDLASNINNATVPIWNQMNEEERWKEIGKIIKETQEIEHRHHTIWEKISDATVRPITGIPIAFGIMFLMFQFIITVGNWIIESVLDPLFVQYYGPWIVDTVNSVAPSGILHDILIGQFVEGELNFMDSFGLLTTGLYIPLVAVLPFVFLFYFALSFLEDFGYLPRLAVLVDTVMHKIGLHGYNIVTVLLGLGCNVPSALSTRILETKKQRFISLTLLAIAVPCMAQTAMIFGVLASAGIEYIFIVFFTLAFLYVILGYILNKMIKGESPALLMEIPPYRKPDLRMMIKKVWIRIHAFLVEAVPFVILGVFIVNILYLTGVMGFFSTLLSPVFEGLFGLPGDASSALLIGFFRKDVAVGMLLPLGMTPEQLTISVTLLAVYFPCVATFTVMIRELGIKDMIKSGLLMISIALIVGIILRLLLVGV